MIPKLSSDDEKQKEQDAFKHDLLSILLESFRPFRGIAEQVLIAFGPVLLLKPDRLDTMLRKLREF